MNYDRFSRLRNDTKIPITFDEKEKSVSTSIVSQDIAMFKMNWTHWSNSTQTATDMLLTRSIDGWWLSYPHSSYTEIHICDCGILWGHPSIHRDLSTETSSLHLEGLNHSFSPFPCLIWLLKKVSLFGTIGPLSFAKKIANNIHPRRNLLRGCNKAFTTSSNSSSAFLVDQRTAFLGWYRNMPQ